MTYEWTMGNWSKYATFPCKQNTKIPATTRGFKDAQFNQDVLEFERLGYNVGLALEPSNLIAIDCDVDRSKGYNGLETLAKLEEKLGKLPTTLTQETPRGGKHFIFSSSGIINPIGKIGKDIDPLEHKIYKNIDIERLFNNCAFLRYCRDNAEVLPEPEWFSMVGILAQIEDSDALIHTLSEPYPKYSYPETQNKIDNARKFGHPQSCHYISASYPEICGNCNYIKNRKRK